MSYPGEEVSNPLNGDGALSVGGVGGAIIMGPGGLITQQALGNKPGVIFGDTTGPNAVNPSGTPNGVRNPIQGGFRSSSTRYR